MKLTKKKKKSGLLVIEQQAPFEMMALSIFEEPMHKSVMLKHLQRALVSMTLVAESAYTTEQAETCIQIARLMGDLARMRKS